MVLTCLQTRNNPSVINVLTKLIVLTNSYVNIYTFIEKLLETFNIVIYYFFVKWSEVNKSELKK